MTERAWMAAAIALVVLSAIGMYGLASVIAA